MEPRDYFGAHERKVADLESFEMRVAQVNALGRVHDLLFYWRGQADGAWGVHSLLHRCLAALRRLPVNAVTEKAVAAAEQALVAEAREWVRPSVGARLTTVDLLARLQHYGIPTRLIDFTRSPYVALYFAVASSPETDGRLVVAAARGAAPPRFREDFRIPWRSGGANRPNDWARNLFALDDQADFLRIIRQHGVFLTGGTPSTNPQRWAGTHTLLADEVRTCMSIPLALHSWAQAEAAVGGGRVRGRRPTIASALTLRIPSDDKASLRASLEDRGISFSSLFPDPEGLREYSDIVVELLQGV